MNKYIIGIVDTAKGTIFYIGLVLIGYSMAFLNPIDTPLTPIQIQNYSYYLLLLGVFPYNIFFIIYNRLKRNNTT